MRLILVTLIVGIACTGTRADELDGPPANDRDWEELSQRELACRSDESNKRIWTMVIDGFEAGSSMLTKGVPFVIELLGQPDREQADEGFWDIDVFEIPRTLYFEGVTVETRDYVGDAVNFDLSTGTVEPTNEIYKMLVESGDFEFAHGLSFSSTREDVEAALGLPCRAVAYLGRTEVRAQSQYSYFDSSDEENARYWVTFNFSGADRVESVRWYYEATWH